MSKANFSDDFKRDVVLQITERGYPVWEVSRWLSRQTQAPFRLSVPSNDPPRSAFTLKVCVILSAMA